MKLKQVMLGIAAAVAIGAGQAQAQSVGPQITWGDDTDLSIGVRLELGLPNLLTSTGPLASTFLIGSFDYKLDCEGCTFWELNGNLAVPIAATTVDPYVGAGLNFAHISIDAFDASDTEIGVNLLGGLRFPIGALNSFAEGRLTLGGTEQLALSFGILFGGK